MGATEQRFLELSIEHALSLDGSTQVPQLTNRGHLEPTLTGLVPGDVIESLRTIFVALGGDENALRSKRASALRPDFIDVARARLVEIDETQHFTTERLTSFAHYPASGVEVGYDIAEYNALVSKWSVVGDRYRAAKATIDFPFRGGRRAQRAYFDAARDLLAPHLVGPVVRVPAPECDGDIAFSRYRRSVDA